MKMTRTALARHATAVAVVLLTFFAQEPIERLVGSGPPPLIFFVPAVTISAWQGGGGPGLLATALVWALCAYNYFPPIGSLAISNPNDVARMVAFVFQGILTSVLMERLHRARRQAEESRREAEGFREASRRAEDWLRAIIDNTDALIYMKNINLTYNIMNRKLREIVGVAEGKVAGLTDHDVFPKGVPEGIEANDRSVLEKGEAMECEEVIPWGDRHHTYVSLKFPLLDSAGVPYAVGGVSTDITLRTGNGDAASY